MRKHQWLGAVAGGLAGVILLLIIGLLVTTYQLAQATREQQLENTKTNDRIEACTTPGRGCFEDAQKRTADAVGSLNDWTEASVACADKSGTQARAEIRACILRTLGQDKR